MNRRDFSTNVMATAIGLSLASGARAQGAPTNGQDYLTLDTRVPVSPGAGKIDVVEFFSYACPHCYEFEPMLESWIKRLPADVAFHRIPVPFLANYEVLQPLYFALEAMNQVDAMQLKVFRAIHVDHQRLDRPDALMALMTKNGIDAQKFMAAYNSFSVHNKVTHASEAMDAYHVDQVPTVAVQGRFVTTPRHAGSFEQALKTVDFLVQQVRDGH
jgi:thiol:disulfide interchange protein DsbA